MADQRIDPVTDALHDGLRLILGGQLHEPMDMSGAGFPAEVERQLELVSRSPLVRFRALLADEYHRPYSEVRDGWSVEDLAMVAAVRAWKAIEDAKRCPNCGVDPAEVQDPDTKRPLAAGQHRIVIDDCWFCAQLKRARESISAEMEKDGFRVRVLPRDPADEFMEIPGDDSDG